MTSLEMTWNLDKLLKSDRLLFSLSTANWTLTISQLLPKHGSTACPRCRNWGWPTTASAQSTKMPGSFASSSRNCKSTSCISRQQRLGSSFPHFLAPLLLAMALIANHSLQHVSIWRATCNLSLRLRMHHVPIFFDTSRSPAGLSACKGA